jgi:homoserine dehydrogenase
MLASPSLQLAQSLSPQPPLHPPPLPALPALPALRVGLLGVGTVGAGTSRVLLRNQALIRARCGRDIELRMAAARNLPRARPLLGPEVELVGDAQRVVRHPQIDVIVEAIGGCDAARTLVLDAIAHGKHVVTANKALLALHGDEIFAAARRQGVVVAFEGAVAVSIPIVKALREGLAGNRIDGLAGIINGTSNFILSAMRERGWSFDTALREAQRLGYAEADPRFDVDGIDAAHKLTLLASMAFGMPLRFDAVAVEGIAQLQAADMRHAEALGYRIKLLGVARRSEEGVELRVQPALVPASHLMAHVSGSMNAVMVKGDAAGVTMYYGAGAGSEQTASAVIADLVDVARLDGTHAAQRVPHLGFHVHAMSELPVLPRAAACCAHYLRVPVHAASHVEAVSGWLAGQQVPVQQVALAAAQPGMGAQVLVLTQPVRQGAMDLALHALQAHPSVAGKVAALCVEALA